MNESIPEPQEPNRNQSGGAVSQRRSSFSFRPRTFFPILLLIGGLFAVLALVKTTQDIRPKAKAPISAKVVRGAAGDLWADTVIGQPDFNQAVPREITNFKVAGPGGVLVDRSVHPNRVYIYDGMNSRILGYSSLGICEDNSSACTDDSDCPGSECQLHVSGVSGEKKADLVIGQPQFNSSACNGDGTFQSYPDVAKATGASMCSMPQDTISIAEYGAFASMAVDRQGNLFVADYFNNRVLQYNTPFTSDSVADEVWGQDNFTGNDCNKGHPPDATTLCFPRGTPSNPLTGGVDVDSSGNLWVSDSDNNRVLRFPNNPNGQVKKVADLVLGQSNFTDKDHGSGLTQLYTPTAVRVDNRGAVYVADSDNNRILVFNPPLGSGIAGTTFAGNFQKPTGIEFDLVTNDPTSGGIWISDTNNHQLVLFDDNGTPKKVLFKDTYRPDGQCGNPDYCPANGGVDLCNMCDARGSIGITSSGDILAASSTFNQDVHYYKHPIPTINPHHPYPAIAQVFFPPVGMNYLSNRGFDSPRGIAVTDSQLIVTDSGRIMYWNTTDPTKDLVNGKPADGVVGVPDFTTFTNPDYLRFAADGRNLWALKDNLLERYSLPLTPGQMPKQTIRLDRLKLLGSDTSIGYRLTATDIHVDETHSAFWLAFPYSDRVARVRIPQDDSGDFTVDVTVGGDPGIPPGDYTWARDCTALPPNSLCAPGSIGIDTHHHLYISDHYLENEGDKRFYRFDASLFPDRPIRLISYNTASAAQRFDDVDGYQPAFDSQNRMVMGFNSFHGPHLPGVYNDILSQRGPTLTPSAQINDWFSQPIAAYFDNRDNLYLADLNRGRVLIYKHPFSSLPLRRNLKK